MSICLFKFNNILMINFIVATEWNQKSVDNVRKLYSLMNTEFRH